MFSELNINISMSKSCDLNPTQAILFAYLFNASKDRDHKRISIGRDQIVNDLSSFFHTQDNVYRNLLQLNKKSLISVENESGIAYIKITELGKKWNIYEKNE